MCDSVDVFTDHTDFTPDPDHPPTACSIAGHPAGRIAAWTMFLPAWEDGSPYRPETYPQQRDASSPAPGATKGNVMDTHETNAVEANAVLRPKMASSHVRIVVQEGKVTLEDLHKALDIAVKQFVPKGGCNCGLTGFDISFLRGDPVFSRALTQIPNIQGAMIEHVNAIQH